MPTAVCKVSLLHILVSISYLQSILIGVKWYLTMVLNYISLMTSEVIYFFHIYVGCLYVFFWYMSIEVFSPFSLDYLGICFLFCYWSFLSSLDILDIKAWWYMLIIPTLKRLRPEDCKFKANLGYVEGPCLQKILDINLLTNVYVSNIFSHSVSCFFTLIIVSIVL
jgi:hypothetical protein